MVCKLLPIGEHRLRIFLLLIIPGPPLPRNLLRQTKTISSSIHHRIHRKCILREDLKHVEIKGTIYIICPKTKKKRHCNLQLIALTDLSELSPNER